MNSKPAEAHALQPTPYTASIDQSLLQHAVFIGCSDDIDPEATAGSLTDQYSIACLLGLFHQCNHPLDPARFQEAMNRPKFPFCITDPSARSTTYCEDIFKDLEAIGYKEFKTKNPKYTIKLVLETSCTQDLKGSIEDHVKVEPGFEKNVRMFIQELNEDL